MVLPTGDIGLIVGGVSSAFRLLFRYFAPHRFHSTVVFFWAAARNQTGLAGVLRRLPVSRIWGCTGISK